MSVLDKAKEHFAESQREIEVPEWDCTVYATAMSLAERKAVKKKGQSDNLEMCAEVLILKARDENGDPMFTRADKLALMREVDSAVVERIANAIYFEPTVEETEKN